MEKKKDFYTLLGLRRNAAPDEIRQAYFDAARRLHPDKNIAPGETELFLDVQEAYEVLSNVKKRARYDASLPPEEAPRILLEQKITFSRQGLMHLEEPQIIYTILEFAAPSGVEKRSEPPLNLCLVLDRSTSMQGNNMDVVKDTAIRIMHKLKPQDVFSVVAFSDRAETLIPAMHVTELGKQEARIQMLQPSGGTEIFSGLNQGYNEILRNNSRSQVNHIILLTDGRTYGDETNCINLAKDASAQGIGISGLGIGSEWNDNFLDQLASITGGSSMYVPRPQDIQHALLDKFTQLGKGYTEETRLEFHMEEGVELRYAFRLQPEAGLLPFESPMMMGPIIWDSSLKILMEFLVQPDALGQNAVTVLNGKIFVQLTNQSPPEPPIPIRLVRPVLDGTNLDPPPLEIVDALSRLKFYRLQEQARLEATAGEYEQAAEHLTRLATHLLAQGERGLAKTALMEAENLQREKSFSQQGGKEIKYGTRALLLKSGRIADKE
ncbi:MAG TPA: VWA domain-containing protein [Anaerolineales bacterium]|nr:VWA domain-containing protein [Anaerolineales bacterium]